MESSPKPWLRRRANILLRAVDGERSKLGDFVEDLDAYRVPSIESLAAQVERGLGTLSEREEQAMRLRFGLDDGTSKTLKQAGQVMGLSAERVRQLEAAALRRLREPGRRNLLPVVAD